MRKTGAQIGQAHTQGHTTWVRTGTKAFPAGPREAMGGRELDGAFANLLLKTKRPSSIRKRMGRGGLMEMGGC